MYIYFSCVEKCWSLNPLSTLLSRVHQWTTWLTCAKSTDCSKDDPEGEKFPSGTIFQAQVGESSYKRRSHHRYREQSLKLWNNCRCKTSSHTVTPKGKVWILPAYSGGKTSQTALTVIWFHLLWSSINIGSDNHWNIDTLSAMGSPTHPRGFSERLPNDPTTSPRVQ